MARMLIRVKIPISVAFFGQVNFLAPLYLLNYNGYTKNLDGFGHGAPPPMLKSAEFCCVTIIVRII